MKSTTQSLQVNAAAPAKRLSQYLKVMQAKNHTNQNNRG
tara:strand:- start:381 stop:497 length:117 start_codon:yes stop_codon:yes gene_type:complete